MNGTRIQKIGRLLAALARRPQDIAPYVYTGPFKYRSPMKYGLPWFSFAAIDFLNQHLRRDMTVFEYGAGASTIFFAERTRRVISTENNPEWAALVQTELGRRGLAAEIQLRPFDFVHAPNFQNSEYLHSIPAQLFDVILIDGTEYDIQVRPDCLKHAEAFVRPGGIIVLDDAWRYTVESSAKERRTFQSAGPARPGVTRTDVFFF